MRQGGNPVPLPGETGGQQQGSCKEKPSQGDRRRGEGLLDGVFKEDPRRSGDRCHHDQPQEGGPLLELHLFVPEGKPKKGEEELPDSLPKEEEHRKEGAPVEDDGEKEVVLPDSQEVLENRQMAGGADGEKFGNPLNQGEKQGREERSGHFRSASMEASSLFISPWILSRDSGEEASKRRTRTGWVLEALTRPQPSGKVTLTPSTEDMG